MPIYLSTLEDVRKAVLGGGFLGGGGGGSLEEGMRLGGAAVSFGTIEVVSVKEASGLIAATVSSVGSQALGRGVLRSANYVEAFLELADRVEVDAIISSENGGMNTLAPWPIAAGLGVPLIDAPADGRAHPTGLMGSMGLHRLEDYVSIQAFSTGLPGSQHRLRGALEGRLEDTSTAIRKLASIHGVLAVVRNPVDSSYLEDNAAVGGLKLALEVGGILLEMEDEPLEAYAKASEKLGGKIIGANGECRVEDTHLETRGGFDVGYADLSCSKHRLKMGFVNEVMYLDMDGERIATFPDLVTPLRVDKAEPLLTADLKPGLTVYLAVVPWKNIPLGSGLKYREAYETLEEAVGVNLTSHIEELLEG